MSKNRKFQMIFTIVLIVIAFIATISVVNASAPSRADLAWPPGPVIAPVEDADRLSNYQDYYQRHPEWHGVSGGSVDIVKDRAPLDECFDVSISELAACRVASTLPSP